MNLPEGADSFNHLATNIVVCCVFKFRVMIIGLQIGGLIRHVSIDLLIIAIICSVQCELH